MEHTFIHLMITSNLSRVNILLIILLSFWIDFRILYMCSVVILQGLSLLCVFMCVCTHVHECMFYVIYFI